MGWTNVAFYSDFTQTLLYLKQIFRIKCVTSTDNMYRENPLIEIEKNNNYDRKRLWKPVYPSTNSPESQNFSISNLLYICELNKLALIFSRKSNFVLIVLATFILGFTFGAVISLYFTPKSVNPKANSETKNHTLKYGSDDFVSTLPRVKSSFTSERTINGVFWSDYVEEFFPNGFGDEDDRLWNEFVQKNTIVRIEVGCGRMQNRLVTFEDGTKACCRYRQNTDQIQGEIFSYYLGRLLKLQNLVPSTLVVYNASNPQWLPVKHQLQSSQWKEDHPVVLTKYVENLLPAQIPPVLRHFTGDVLTTGHHNDVFSQRSNIFENVFKKPGSGNTLKIIDWLKNEEDIVEMVQWSDLIIFDYLTANLDRVVNNLYNLQWNPDMLSSPAHNLARIGTSDLLVFLDNESGLLHGYRLLDKYEPYHSLMLDALCVFRKSTVDALSAFSLQGYPSSVLSGGFSSQEMLPSLPEKNINILSQRVARVLRQVVSCTQGNEVSYKTTRAN